MAEVKYNVGDYVIYGNNGVCLIEDIIEKDFGEGKKSCYALKAVYGNTMRIYLSVESPKVKDSFRKVLSEERVREILDTAEDAEIDWEADSKERANKLNAIISGGDRAEIFKMLRAMYLRKKGLELSSKKLYASDERALSSAEKLIGEEFAFVLGVEKEEIIRKIKDMISE